jgi:hypothetical protein
LHHKCGLFIIFLWMYLIPILETLSSERWQLSSLSGSIWGVCIADARRAKQVIRIEANK